MNIPQEEAKGVPAYSTAQILKLKDFIDLLHHVGWLTKAVNTLEDQNKTNIEKIDHLSQWIPTTYRLEEQAKENARTLNELNRNVSQLDKDAHAAKIQWDLTIPSMQSGVAKNANDLDGVGRRHDRDINELKKVIDTASKFFKIAVGVMTPVAATVIVAILVFIYHFVVRLFYLAFNIPK
jgi:hypothetical protein